MRGDPDPRQGSPPLGRASQGGSAKCGSGPHLESGSNQTADRILASFPRDVDGEPAAMRVVIQEFNGRPLLHLRTWIKGRDGSWHPTKTGVTVRATEIDAVIVALTKARDAIRADGRLTHQPHPPARADTKQPRPSRNTVSRDDGIRFGEMATVPADWPTDPETGLPEPPW